MVILDKWGCSLLLVFLFNQFLNLSFLKRLLNVPFLLNKHASDSQLFGSLVNKLDKVSLSFLNTFKYQKR